MKLKPGPKMVAIGLSSIIMLGVVGTVSVARAQEGEGGPAAAAGQHRPAKRLAKLGFRQLVKASGLERDVVAQGLKDGESLREIFTSQGVDTDEVIDEVLADLQATLAQKVEQGQITQELADKLYGRAEVGLPKLVDAHRQNDGERPGHPRLHRFAVQELSIAAEAIGIPLGDLVSSLRAGDTIADVAEENGVDVQAVIDAMFEPVSDRLDAAAEAGKIDPETAERLKGRALERITKFVNEGLPERPAPR